MRPDAAGRALFDRAVTIHRQDCEIVAGAGIGGLAATEVAEAPEWTAAPDAVVAYRVEAGKVFDTLRCLIGQLAGLLILAQASGRSEILDLPDLGIAAARLAEAETALSALAAPAGLAAHKARLEQARRQIAESHVALGRLGEIGRGAAALAEASDRIATAYRTLKAASDVEAGLTMVDFRQACCTCASAATTRPGGRA
jgi:hypothetical protein